MKLRMVTWNQFHSGNLPKAPERRKDTFLALRVLRGAYGTDMLGGFMKWGMPAIRDMAAFLIFYECHTESGFTEEEAMGAASLVLRGVEWGEVETLFKDGTEEYQESVRKQEMSEDLAKSVESLSYRLPAHFDGIEKPGDFYEKVMRAFG